jgi:predicted Zn-dependent peptidase
VFPVVRGFFNKVFTLLHTHLPESATVTTAVFVRVGSEYENEQENGISHFLEHMCFRGTKKYPNHRAISQAFESLGTSSEAFTSNECTYYYVKAANQDFQSASKVLFDVICNPSLNAADVAKEKGVVIEEINMNEDDPQSVVWDRFNSTLYPQEAAGRRILGTPTSIKKISAADLRAYHARYYLPSQIVISIAGNVSQTMIQKEIVKAFAGKEGKEVIPKKRVDENQQGFVENILRKKSNQTNFVLGFRAFPVSDKRHSAVRVLESILGGTESSRLWQKIYGEMGAAYSIGATTILGSDHGCFAIAGGIENQRFSAVLKVIRNELRDIVQNGVSSEELVRTKEYSIARQSIANETSEDWALFSGEQEIMEGKIEPIEKIIQRYKKVTRAEIHAVAKALFTNKNMNLAVVGPVKKNSFAREVLI